MAVAGQGASMRSFCFAVLNVQPSFTGVARSSLENLRRSRLEAFQLLAGNVLGLTGAHRTVALATGMIVEVTCND